MVLVGPERIEAQRLALGEQLDPAAHQQAGIAVDIGEKGRQAEMPEFHDGAPPSRQRRPLYSFPLTLSSRRRGSARSGLLDLLQGDDDAAVLHLVLRDGIAVG